MKLVTTMPDGSRWAVPLEMIADNRHAAYTDDSLEATLHYLDRHPDEAIDWARNNMNWEDVKRHATQIDGPARVDFQDGWVNGYHEIIK